MKQPDSSPKTEDLVTAMSPFEMVEMVEMVEMAQLRQAFYRFLGMLFLYPDATRLAKVQIAAGELLAARKAWHSLDCGPPLERLLTVLVGLNNEAAEQVEEEYNT